MPHAAWCLRILREAGITLGLLSNAQFFTKELFPALFGANRVRSWVSHQSCSSTPTSTVRRNPGSVCILPPAALAKLGIRPAETLCLGNDMVNDVVPAARLGFRTALFAGDQRSLRWVEGPKWSTFAPDVVLTDLDQLPSCLTRVGSALQGGWPWRTFLRGRGVRCARPSG